MKIHGNIIYKERIIRKVTKVILLKRIRHHKRFRYIALEKQYTNQEGEYIFEMDRLDSGYYKVIALE